MSICSFACKVCNAVVFAVQLMWPNFTAGALFVHVLLSSKEQTTFCLNLSLESTLPSILQCKVNGFSDQNFFEFEPSNDLLK